MKWFARASIPTIDIGSGPKCYGQVLFLHDILDIYNRIPPFAKKYTYLNNIVTEALSCYKKKVEKGVATGTAILVSVVVTFVIAVVLFKFVWAWVVPDLFPGAVEQGLIAADLTWLASLKLAVLVAVLSGFGPALSGAFVRQ